jgi:nicotinate-nucleotide pyrophosphorylase (carboxylating)
MQREILMNEYKLLVKDKIKAFLYEDLGYGDITSESLISPEQQAKAKLYFKKPGVVSGLTEASIVFELLGCESSINVEEGTTSKAKVILMEVFGSARSILIGERLALNLVGRMAGIATQTSKIIAIARSSSPEVRVAATRKTMPGLRVFDKRAVQHGGGDSHRFGLDDCVIIKDNHLRLLHSINEAINKAREKVSFTKKIEVEVKSLVEAVEAAETGADIIMFDNMQPHEIIEALKELDSRQIRKGLIFEASGGITIENISEYADSGVDIISLGSLTHSTKSLDVKLEVEMK